MANLRWEIGDVTVTCLVEQATVIPAAGHLVTTEDGVRFRPMH